MTICIYHHSALHDEPAIVLWDCWERQALRWNLDIVMFVPNVFMIPPVSLTPTAIFLLCWKYSSHLPRRKCEEESTT